MKNIKIMSMKNPKKGATKRIAYGGVALVFVLCMAALAASTFGTGGAQEASALLSKAGPCIPSNTVKCGNIRIKKDTVLDSYQDFFFYHTIPGYAPSFILDDDSTLINPSNLPNSISFSTPSNGNFVVNEPVVAGYLTSISCVDSSGGTIISGSSVSISMYGGESVTCTFKNVQQAQACISDTWTQKADYGGPSGNSGIGFSIADKGYMGTGTSGSQQFWEYNPATNVWTQRANFGGGSRRRAVGFSIGTNGYVGTGINSDAYADFWQYNPALNTWTQKASFGGGIRVDAVGFSVGNKGYIGTGAYFGFTNDFWEYDPLGNTWVQKAGLPGAIRYDAVGFSIGNRGYIGLGANDNGTLQDFWEYNPSTNVWTQKANLTGGSRRDAVGFSIGNKGYVGTGSTSYNYQDFWRYDPVTNTWLQRANFGGGPRTDTVGFSVGNKGYIGMGHLLNNINNHKDFWEYCP